MRQRTFSSGFEKQRKQTRKEKFLSETDRVIRYLRLRVLPPIGKEKRYPPQTVTVICAQERDAPGGCEGFN